jgi:hypothetical protein
MMVKKKEIIKGKRDKHKRINYSVQEGGQQHGQQSGRYAATHAHGAIQQEAG